MKTKQVLIKKGPDSLSSGGYYSCEGETLEVTFVLRQSDFSEGVDISELLLVQEIKVPETIKECKTVYGVSKAQIVGIVNDELGIKDES